MCAFHKKLWDELSCEDARNERAQLEMKRIYIAVNDGVLTSNYSYVESGNCQPLMIKREDGRVAGCFSCEVATD
jgi:hypothetical protein